VVYVKVHSPSQRGLIFSDVVVRVRPDFALAMHIDTDEANAAGLNGDAKGEIIISL
jgi:propanediol utilization protein